jgi:hypothetical protein
LGLAQISNAEGEDQIYYLSVLKSNIHVVAVLLVVGDVLESRSQLQRITHEVEEEGSHNIGPLALEGAELLVDSLV